MIKENIINIKKRIGLACAKIKRSPEEVVIVAVVKNRSPEQIKEALSFGITDIGENRLQEAKVHYYGLGNIKWHMVGHLQTNKVRSAVQLFDLIQSVDSLNLAIQINKEAWRLNKIQDILIEVKTSPEAAKFGINPPDTLEVIKELSGLKNINIKGLMTIAPIVDNPQDTRPYFRTLKELKDKINHLRLTTCDLPLLSMGMSDDFEVAIEEGATMIRLGRAIFEG